MDYIDTFFSSFIDVIKNIVGDNQLSSLLGDGVIAGVSAVVMFLPNILILFLGISLLEGTGYMSRVAFLLDGTFHKFGLHGKSFIPLVTGFGCSVPAYMAARTLKNERDKLLTLFIIGFMSCGARLPIYVLFVGAFFGSNNAGNILFVIYISGAILGLFAAKFLRAVVFKGKDEPFVMEMPKYRLPSLKLVYKEITNKAFMYLKKAGTFILAASILIWFMSNYPKYPNIEDEINQKIELAINDEVKKERARNNNQEKNQKAIFYVEMPQKPEAQEAIKNLAKYDNENKFYYLEDGKDAVSKVIAIEELGGNVIIPSFVYDKISDTLNAERAKSKTIDDMMKELKPELKKDDETYKAIKETLKTNDEFYQKMHKSYKEHIEEKELALKKSKSYGFGMSM